MTGTRSDARPPAPDSAMRAGLQRYAVFLAIATGCFLVIAPGAQVLARMQVTGLTLPAAFAATLQHVGADPAPFMLGYVPFAAAAWVAGSLANRMPRSGGVLLAVCIILFALLHYGGQTDAQKFLLQKDDAEATLATGVVQFRSLGVVLLAFVLRFLASRGPSAAARARAARQHASGGPGDAP